MSKCRPVTKAWSPIWYKLDCNDVVLTSGDDSIIITRIEGDCCGWDLQAVNGGGSGSVTSVGLTMPSAFSVASSPVTTSGTIVVTGAGTTAQYIRGDGTLAAFPSFSTYTVDNGLSPSTASNFQLGGTLLHDTVINTGTDYSLSVVGSGAGIPFKVNSGNNISAQFNSLTSIAVQAVAGDSFPAGHFTNNTPYADSVIDALHAQHQTAVPVVGVGVGISMNASDDVGIYRATRLVAKWTNITHATRTSQFIITGTNSGTESDLITLFGSGALRLNKYGLGTFTGTAAYTLRVDASGNLIEGALDSFYTNDGSLSSGRTVDGDGFSLTFTDLSLFRIVNGDATIGGTYDFTTGVDLLAYNATNSSNLILDPLSGMKFQYTTLAGPTVNSSLEVTPTGVKLTGIPEYADNAAAIVGGLINGYLYRTGDALKIVH